jgi:hypothetical protein
MRWIVGSLLIASACGPVVADEGDGTTGEDPTDTSPTSQGNPTTDPTTDPSTDPSAPSTMSTSGNPTTDPSTDPTIDPVDTSDSDPTCGDFIGCYDGGGDGGWCTAWDQNCVRGEKCMPWSNDGGPHWNTERCSPIDPDARAPGEPCMVEGSYVSGIDNCELGSVCLFVDPATNTGVCIASCSGSEDNPVCASPGDVCSIDFDGAMVNCLPSCDPLLQDCSLGGCYPTPFGDFVCGATIGMGVGPGEPCVHQWDCVEGSVCVEGDLVPDCADEGCCAPLCDVSMPEQCEGLTCEPWYEPGTSPGLEALGVCIIGE